MHTYLFIDIIYRYYVLIFCEVENLCMGLFDLFGFVLFLLFLTVLHTEVNL